MASTVASRKAKGRRLTQELCSLLLSISDQLNLGLTDEDIRPVPSSVPGEDVWLSSKARACFPFSFECKNQEKVSLWTWWKQCAANAFKGEPVLVIKRNRDKPKVVIELDTFIGFLYAGALGSCKSRRSFHSGSEGLLDTAAE